MQQPIGEHMTALAVATQLDFVDGDEIHLTLCRHGLDRADPVARPRRHTLLLPSDQGHCPLAHPRGHPVVHLARQQAQRQADHSASVLQHPLDRTMGLPGVGRPQLGEDGLRAVGTERMHGPKNSQHLAGASTKVSYSTQRH